METEELIKDINEASKASVECELSTHFLLGDTEEFDNFEPELISLNFCSNFDAYKIACCKFVGFKTVENEQEASKIWKELSEKGEPNSLLEYSAELFASGKVKEGFTCLLRSSKAGNTTAIFRIALCYLYGIHVVKDEAKGVQLMKLLSQKKYPDALYFISILNSTGAGGFELDETKGEEILLEAVNLGSKFAMTEYGFRLYLTGETPQEKKKGFDYLRDSADNGDPRADTIVSVIYAKGEEGVVEASEEQSKIYLTLAYDQKYLPAVKLVDELKDAGDK